MGKRMKMLLLVAALMVLGGVYTLGYGASTSQQTATLSGVVSEEGLAVVGQEVKEGDTLVLVRSIAGLMPAARANTDGKVTAVLVKAGDHLKNGQVVAEVTSEGK